MKTCSKCKCEKHETDFYKTKPGTSRTWCKDCEREYQRNIYANNPHMRRHKSKLWRKNYANKYKEIRKLHRYKAYITESARRYGLSRVEIEMLLDRSNGKCAICEIVFGSAGVRTRRCIDHCHKTNKLRGLVCDGCNRIMGIANDNCHRLRQIINYLENGQCTIT